MTAPALWILAGVMAGAMLASAAELVRCFSLPANVRLLLEGAILGWIVWGLLP